MPYLWKAHGNIIGATSSHCSKAFLWPSWQVKAGATHGSLQCRCPSGDEMNVSTNRYLNRIWFSSFMKISIYNSSSHFPSWMWILSMIPLYFWKTPSHSAGWNRGLHSGCLKTMFMFYTSCQDVWNIAHSDNGKIMDQLVKPSDVDNPSLPRASNQLRRSYMLKRNKYLH